MTGKRQVETVGQLPPPTGGESRVPAVLTRLVWVLWVASLGVGAVQHWSGAVWEVAGLVVVDGLTVVMWTTATFLSGVVHSYSRRYMAGTRAVDRFFRHAFGFTLLVVVLVAADSFLLFAAVWLATGLVVAELVGHVGTWPQAQAAATLARRYFLASSGLVAVGLLALWWHTGTARISEVASAVRVASRPVVLFAAGAFLAAAAVQSGLVPFHAWLLSSMTAPTPASALMHAGFVNAGGILLVRFAPVVTADAGLMLVVVSVGAASALLGKLLKTVRTDIKGKLGCSTVGQMGFMIVQAGLGFFGAAVAHLVLHGFYKSYQFLRSGGRVVHESPAETQVDGSTGPVGVAAVVATAVAGGALFAILTGKGAETNSGLVLTLLVVLTVLHAARQFVARTSLPAPVRYGVVPVVTLPAIAVYAAVYLAVAGALSGLPAVGQPTDLTVVHGVVAVAFVSAYIAVESGRYKHSQRLYVALLNATQPASDTQLTATEEYGRH